MAKPTFSIRTAGAVRVVSFECPGGVSTPPEFAEAVEEMASQLPGDTGGIVDGRGPNWG